MMNRALDSILKACKSLFGSVRRRDQIVPERDKSSSDFYEELWQYCQGLESVVKAVHTAVAIMTEGLAGPPLLPFLKPDSEFQDLCFGYRVALGKAFGGPYSTIENASLLCEAPEVGMLTREICETVSFMGSGIGQSPWNHEELAARINTKAGDVPAAIYMPVSLDDLRQSIPKQSGAESLPELQIEVIGIPSFTADGLATDVYKSVAHITSFTALESLVGTDIFNTVMEDCIETLMAHENRSSGLEEHNRIVELGESSDIWSRPDPAMMILPLPESLEGIERDFHTGNTVFSASHFPVGLVLPSEGKDENDAMLMTPEEYMHDVITTIREFLLIPDQLQQSGQALMLMITTERGTEDSGRSLAVGEVNIPAMDFQIPITRFTDGKERHQPMQTMTASPQNPTTTNTFNITVNVSASSGEDDLKVLGQKISSILINEARRHGINMR